MRLYDGNSYAIDRYLAEQDDDCPECGAENSYCDCADNREQMLADEADNRRELLREEF